MEEIKRLPSPGIWIAFFRNSGRTLFYSRIGTQPTYANAHNIIAQISFFLVAIVRFCQSPHQTLLRVSMAALHH
jgi:hypothetical protein